MGSHLREQFHSDLRILSITSSDKSAELLLGVLSEDTQQGESDHWECLSLTHSLTP